MNIERIEEEKTEFIKTLTQEKLLFYIDSVIKNCYIGYIGNNPEKLDLSIHEIQFLINSLEEIYPNVKNYINYRFVVVGGDFLHKIVNRETLVFFGPDVGNIDDDNLSNLFDDDRIRQIIEEEEELEKNMREEIRREILEEMSNELS